MVIQELGFDLRREREAAVQGDRLPERGGQRRPFQAKLSGNALGQGPHSVGLRFVSSECFYG